MSQINGKPKVIKEINIALVRKNIIKYSPITKPELSKMLGLSLPTINKCVDELYDNNIVKIYEGDIEVKGSGKKPIFYEINRNYVSYLVLYFKGNSIIVREYNILGDIKNEKIEPLKDDADIKEVTAIIDKMLAESENSESIEVIAVGIPGLVEEDGCLSNIYTLKNLNGIFLKKELEKKYKKSVIVENDVNLIAVGLINDIKGNIKDLVYLYLGTGIGAGLIINGKLHRGKSNFAGEIGEVPIATDEIMEEAYQHSKDNQEKFERMIIFILTMTIAILNPEVVVINSSIFKLDKKMLKNIIAKITDRFKAKNMPKIILDDKDVENGMKGALSLALEESDRDLQIIGK